MKQTKLLLGACLALTLAGCSDEVGITADRLPVSGDEIAFGATAGQFTEPAKRTIYGVPAGEYIYNFSRLEIDWVADKDQVRVFCDQPSEQRWGDYTVVGSEADGYYLKKNDENKPGVRWGNDLTTPHTFYSFYPLTTSNGASISGLQSDTKVRATIPTAQIAGTYHAETDQKNGRTWHIIDPDMSYAMMVGKGTWTPDQDKKVALTYKPIVTVLDVYVTGNASTAYKVMGVGVRSDKQPIVGTFDYDAATDQCTYVTPESGSQDDKWAYIETVDGNGNPINIAAGQSMNVKFFLLPQDINSDELEVSVLLNNGQVLRQRLSQEGQGNNLVKGEIVKVLTPQIKPSDVSNWMSAIGNDVLFASQLSLPGTKHSYSYLNYERNTAYPWQPSNAERNTYDANTGMMQTYQTLDIGQQFDAGVRAFNIKVYGNEDSHIYVAGSHSSALRLDNFLTTLKQKLDAAPTEFAIVTIDFVQDDKQYTAQQWLDRVCNTINNWSDQNPANNVGTDLDGTTDNDAEKDYFRDVTAETTVGVMRHGIGVVIFAPGDQTYSSENVNIVKNYPTSVQQTAIWHANMSSNLGSADITIQNLEQNNNPTLNQPDGLYPYFITEQNVLNRTSMNLIQTKKDLITELMRESWRNNNGSTSVGEKTSHLYLNDLSGFCVVNNTESTGWADAEWADATDYGWPVGLTWNDGIAGYQDGWNDIKLTDYRNYANYTFFTDPDHQGTVGTPVPEDPTAEGQTALRITGRANSVVGNGGNNALLASQINPYAESEIRRFVNDGRTPLGIVYMSFAGTPTVDFNGTTYDVNGTTLPALIVANNFKFALATSKTAQQGN